MALIYQPSKRIFCGWFEPLKSTTYSEYPFCLAAPFRFAGLLEHRSQRDVEAVLEQMFNELLEKIHGGQFSADEEVKDGDLE